MVMNESVPSGLILSFIFLTYKVGTGLMAFTD